MGACLLCYGVGHNATPTKMAGELLTKQGKSAFGSVGNGDQGVQQRGVQLVQLVLLWNNQPSIT